MRAGELLEAHIRLEERQLFSLIEDLVPDDELRRLGLADRNATCAVRRPPSRAGRVWRFDWQNDYAWAESAWLGRKSGREFVSEQTQIEDRVAEARE
jgi:hypothetical protein